MRKNQKFIYTLRDTDLDIDNFYDRFPRCKYVDLMAEEPLTDLLLYEVEEYLRKIDLSPNEKVNKITKLIVYLHCLGYSDKEISDGFEKLLLFIGPDAVKKRRQRALQKINDFFGREIGFITLMYETFKNLEFLD